MKLQTSIKPRRDGVVKATSTATGKVYEFSADADSGELACDVTDEKDIAQLLSTENFWPANPEDFDAAEQLTMQVAVLDTDGDEGDESEFDDEGDDPVNESAMPLEANTPPARNKPGPKPKHKTHG